MPLAIHENPSFYRLLAGVDAADSPPSGADSRKQRSGCSVVLLTRGRARLALSHESLPQIANFARRLNRDKRAPLSVTRPRFDCTCLSRPGASNNGRKPTCPHGLHEFSRALASMGATSRRVASHGISKRTQNGHIRNDTRDASRGIRPLWIAPICSRTVSRMIARDGKEGVDGPMHELCVTGAQTGARQLKYLQIGHFETVSKAVRGHWPLEGSNPSPSAQPGGSWSGSRVGTRACGLLDRSAQSTQVRGRLPKSTGLRRPRSRSRPRLGRKPALARRNVTRLQHASERLGESPAAAATT